MRRVDGEGKVPGGFGPHEKKNEVDIKKVGKVFRTAIECLEECGKTLISVGTLGPRSRATPPRFKHSAEKTSDSRIGLIAKQRRS